MTMTEEITQPVPLVDADIPVVSGLVDRDETAASGNAPVVTPPQAPAESAIEVVSESATFGEWLCLAERDCEAAAKREPFQGPTFEQARAQGEPLECPECGGTVIIMYVKAPEKKNKRGGPR